MTYLSRVLLVLGIGVSWVSFGQAISAADARTLLAVNQITAQQGKFSQKKYFKRLAKPFVSSGEFNIDQQGLRWQTLKPVKSAIVITENTMLLENGAGEQTHINQGEMYARLLKQLMLGQFEALAPYFAMNTTSQQHCILLEPTDDNLSQLMSSVTLCGQGRIATLELLDKHQNKTEIALHYDDMQTN